MIAKTAAAPAVDRNHHHHQQQQQRDNDNHHRVARLSPCGAFGLPSSFSSSSSKEIQKKSNGTTPSSSDGCRAIVFLDDTLCAFPVGHGVLLVESDRGRQVAFVPGTPGQRRVTAIAAKKCSGGESARSESKGEANFDEEEKDEERGKGGQRLRKEAGVSLSSSDGSESITFTGETASLLAIAESGDEEIGPTIVLFAIHRQTQRRVRLRTLSLRDAIGSDGKKSSVSPSGAMAASVSGCLGDYTFTEVCFSTDGSLIVAKAQRVSDENDWTLRSWTFSDLTKRNSGANGDDISNNQEGTTSNPFPASSAYLDIFSAGKKSASVSNVSYVLGFLPEPRISVGQRNNSTSHSNPTSLNIHPRERNTVSAVAAGVIRLYKLPQKSETDLYAASSATGSRGVIKLFSVIPFGEAFEADEPVDHAWLERGNGERVVVAFESGHALIVEQSQPIFIIRNCFAQSNSCNNVGATGVCSIGARGFCIFGSNGSLSVYNRNAERKITAGKDPYGKIRVWTVRRRNQAYEDSLEEEKEEEEEKWEEEDVRADAGDELGVKKRFSTSRASVEVDGIRVIDTSDSAYQSQEPRWITERGAIVSADVSPCGETLVVWMDHPTNELYTLAVADADASVREGSLDKESGEGSEHSTMQSIENGDVFQVLLRENFSVTASERSKFPGAAHSTISFSSTLNQETNNTSRGGSNMISHNAMLPSLSSRASHCALKPILATCSSDGAVRIWSTREKNKMFIGGVVSSASTSIDGHVEADKLSIRGSSTSASAESSSFSCALELCEHFPETPLSIALHPSGHILLVGFNDKLRMFYIHHDTLEKAREFSLKNVRDVSFSHGGHKFVAAHGNCAKIFDTYTGATVSTLRGHSSKVRRVRWTSDDENVVTIGADGCCYRWELHGVDALSGEHKRNAEHSRKGCRYDDVALLPKELGNGVFLVGSDRTIKELDGEKFGAGSCREFEISSSMSAFSCTGRSDVSSETTFNQRGGDEENIKMTLRRRATTLTSACFLHSSRLLVCGTSCGALRVYTTPLTGEFREYRCASNREITSICASDTEERVFVCASDGTMFAFEIMVDSDLSCSTSDKPTSRFGKNRSVKDTSGAVAPDDVLISRFVLLEKEKSIADLRSRIRELCARHEYERRVTDQQNREEVNRLETQRKDDLEREIAKRTRLRETFLEERAKTEEKTRSEDETRRTREEHKEREYRRKLAKEFEKIENLKVVKDAEIAKWDEQNSALVQAHEAYIKESEAKLEKETQLLQDKITQLELEIRTEREVSEETQRQVEEDADEEIESLKKVFQENVEYERHRSAELRIEHAKTRKLRENATRNEELMREEASLAKRERDILKEVLEKTRQSLAERDTEIRDLNEDKKKSAHEMQKKIALERKLTSQLKERDERLNDVDFKIVPKFERTLNDLNERLELKDKEILKVLAEVKALKGELEETTRKGESFRKEAKLKRRNAEKAQQLIKRFQRDLFQVVDRKANEDFKALKDAVVQLYSRYAREEERKENEVHLTRAEETALAVQKRNDALEQTVEKLRKQLQKECQVRRMEVSKVLKENLELVKAEQERKKEKNTPATEEQHQPFTELNKYLQTLTVQ